MQHQSLLTFYQWWCTVILYESVCLICCCFYSCSNLFQFILATLHLLDYLTNVCLLFFTCYLYLTEWSLIYICTTHIILHFTRTYNILYYIYSTYHYPSWYYDSTSTTTTIIVLCTMCYMIFSPYFSFGFVSLNLLVVIIIITTRTTWYHYSTMIVEV